MLVDYVNQSAQTGVLAFIPKQIQVSIISFAYHFDLSRCYGDCGLLYEMHHAAVFGTAL